MIADRRETVVKTLRSKGYYLVSIKKEAKLLSLLHAGGGLTNRVGVRDRAIFTHQLGTLLKAGMQLSFALKTLPTQTENKTLASTIQQLQSDVEQSSSLSQAMGKHPRIFSRVYTAIVKSAEQTGNLGETLAVLSHQLKTQDAVSKRIRGALVYPLFLLAVSAAVVSVLTIVVIPRFLELFANSQETLPWPTQILIQVVHFCRQFWWMALAGVAGLGGLVLVALREPHLRLSAHSLLLKLPVTGALTLKLQLAGFARTLGSLLKGGVQVVSAIATTQGTTANLAFAENVAQVEEALLKGFSLAEAVGRQPHFNQLIANMIAVGEETGMLTEMLLDVADMYDQDCEASIAAMTSLLGPSLIVVLGVIIGFVVMAILLPIFETTTFIS